MWILIWEYSWHRIIFITKENKTISNFLINKKSFKASHRSRSRETESFWVYKSEYKHTHIYISTRKRSIRNFEWLPPGRGYTYKWIIHIIQWENIFQVGLSCDRPLLTLQKEMIWQIFSSFLLHRNLENKSICLSFASVSWRYRFIRNLFCIWNDPHCRTWDGETFRLEKPYKAHIACVEFSLVQWISRERLVLSRVERNDLIPSHCYHSLLVYLLFTIPILSH